MNFHKQNKYFQWGFTAFLVIVASISFYYLIFHGEKLWESVLTIGHILRPIVFGAVIAYMLTPVLNLVEYHLLLPVCKRIRIPITEKRKSVIRVIGVVSSLFLLFLVLYCLLAMILSQIVPSMVNIVNNFDRYANNFMKWLNSMLAAYPEAGEYMIHTVHTYSDELRKWLNDLLFNKTSNLIKTISVRTINVLGMLWNVMIGLILSIYLLYSKEKFAGQAKKIVFALWKQDTAHAIIHNFRFANKTFTRFLIGKIVDSLCVGILCFIGTSIMQTPYAALISVIIGVTNIIPFLGPYLGAIPSILFVFIVDPSHSYKCLYFALFIVILQQIDGNLLGPKIVGNSIGLTGFWVIFAITLFGGLFGVLGMIVGVPIFAIIYAAIKSYIHGRLQQKNLSGNTKDYMVDKQTAQKQEDSPQQQ